MLQSCSNTICKKKKNTRKHYNNIGHKETADEGMRILDEKISWQVEEQKE